MHISAQDLLLALAIGAEVFAVAALWPLSEWAATARRQSLFLAALVDIVACVALDMHGLAFPTLEPGSWRWGVAHALQWTTVPLFIAFPDAVCVASAQSLMRAGVAPRRARTIALGIAAIAVLVAPAGTFIADCGLAGACY